MTDLTIDIGIDEADRQAITEGLSRLLADSYTLYLKTHNYHWNVTGPMFQTLHLMFETQYNELALAVDLIAERIRSLGAPAPAQLPRVRRAVVGHRRRRPTRRHRDDPSAREGPGGGGAYRTLGVPCRREGPRRTDRRPAHPTNAGAREDRVDAAQPPRLTRAAAGICW